ncbi:thioredoxin TrxA [Endozoicomonas euniceicola]|uniref:Thioredoxin n=1 Tax=Endozoicomonas euniceicola TaxID=1234143 RepID=A0ABY6GZP9_9GAMM|nr:thioredoxin family protein [Endozoicomonas euniceicola]UYM17516.1 thioredoxin family protein [Endozoicomonas euniceicola]
MIELGKENFDSEIKEHQGVAMVDFWGESCGRCLELMPDVVELAGRYESEMKFAKLNIKGNRRVAMGQGVMGLPSIVFYKDGEKIEHLTGEELEADQIEEAIKRYI